jgi:hypothetical protein
MGVQKLISYLVLALLPVMMVSYMMQTSCKKNTLVYEQTEKQESIQGENFQENELASDMVDIPDFLFSVLIAFGHTAISSSFEYFKSQSHLLTSSARLVSPPPQVV